MYFESVARVSREKLSAGGIRDIKIADTLLCATGA